MLLDKDILICLAAGCFQISLPAPPTPNSEPLVNNGFTADAISRSTFVHAVQRHQRNSIPGGLEFSPLLKLKREQVAISPVVAIEITALSQIILIDREQQTAQICSLQ